MEHLEVICPSCKAVFSRDQCESCGLKSREFAPMLRGVLAAYGRAVEAAKGGDLGLAHATLSQEISVFPFPVEPLHFLLRLALEVGDFESAKLVLSWLRPALEDYEYADAVEFVRASAAEYNSLLDGTTSGPLKHNLAILNHLNQLQSDKTESVAVTDDTSNTESRRHHRILIFVAVAVVLLAATTGTMAWRGHRTSVMASIQQEEYASLASVWNTTRDSLELKITELQTKTKEQHKDSQFDEYEVANSPIKADVVSRFEELGANAAYRVLRLDDASAVDRPKSMAMFVEVFPNSTIYTGYFLRELHDIHVASQDRQAREYAFRLQAYVQEHPSLDHLISGEVQISLAGAETR